MEKNLNKKLINILITILLCIFFIFLLNIYKEEYTSNCVYSIDDNIIHNESRYCTKNGDVLKNQFLIYQLNRNEDGLILFMYEYSGNKENKITMDEIDYKNFLTLTKDYIENYKYSKNYKKNLELLEYIYKTYHIDKYEEFKKEIK